MSQAPADTEALASLLAPLQIGSLLLRNRVVFGAHGTGFGTDGTVNDRHIAYHLERARGGVGLIIMEATGVDASPTGVTTAGRNIRNATDDIIPSYRRISAAVHAEGARIFTLLSHSGRNTTMGSDGMPPKAPSPLPMERTRDIPHALEVHEIEDIVARFARAAARCREGGLDGVSLSFAHGNLVQQFLSPAANKRTDIYGGSEENRLRLAKQVLRACRAAVGDDYVLGIRFSAAELVPGGYDLEAGKRYARLFVEWGKLDFIDVSAGDNASMRSRSFHYPTIAVENGALVPLARAIKQVVSVPVFAVGKIGSAVEAEQIVAAGDADMVVMVRAHIAEPEIVAKVTSGRADDIRECIYCNETCFGRQQRFGDISCVYNPRSGRELAWPALAPAAQRRKVVVVGGGPAGLEAARTAARRGHDVTLYEAAGELGGQIRILQRTPHREGYGKIADWLTRQVEKAGVDVRLGTRADAATLLSHNPDSIVIATGARDSRPDVPGAELPHVVTAREALEDRPLGHRVLIGDWDGKYAGTTLAEKLALAGHAVTLVTEAFYPGMDGDLMTWRALYERLLDLDVAMLPLHRIARIGRTAVEVQDLAGRITTHDVDGVVVASRGEADRPLYQELHGKVESLFAIGDCWAPRQLEQAIYEGAKIGRAL